MKTESYNYQQYKERIEWLDRHSFCHKCGKAKVAPHRKFCFDCLDKIREENAARYDPAKAHEYQKRRRELYAEKKETGICVRCSKEATHGLYCYEHSIQIKRNNAKKAAHRKRERHERGLIPEYRAINNLCVRCGNPLDIDGYKLCSACIKQNTENSKLADKSGWRALESARYEKNRNWREKHIER